MSIDEKVYFESPQVKVTDSRVIFGHDSVPVKSIRAVETDLRALTLYMSFIVLTLSLGSLFFAPYAALLLVGLAFIWARYEYTHYVGIMVNLEGGSIKIASSSIVNRDCAYKIEEAINLSLSHRKRRDSVPGLGETETMQFRRLIIKEAKVDVSALEAIPRSRRPGQMSQAA